MNHDRDSRHDKHVEKLAAKHLQYEGKLALLKMHEADPCVDHEYLIGLRARVRSIKVQLLAMKPGEISRAGSVFD